MSYLGLATKYRPKKFQHIVGQPDAAIVREIFRDLDTLPPLLLFCGPSGVGKTTIARIIAATANCSNRGETAEPCGKCSECVSVFSDGHPSVYEIDAASYGTADALRDLVSKAHMQSAGVNTFIIDEAQSISAQGWNVLLKVLEEPPSNCLFILLTSEPRKVPSKIRTRGLKFTFQSIPPKLVYAHLSMLVSKTSVDLSDNDINVIVDKCGGSLRDAYMMVEQCVLSEFTAEELFSNRDMSLEYFSKILSKDYAGTLEVVENWWGEVGDAKAIVSQMTDTLEKIALFRSGVQFYGGTTSQDRLKVISDALDINTVASCLEQLSEWFSRALVKAQITLLTAKLYKVINGSVEQSVAVEPKPVVRKGPEAVAASALRTALEGF